MKNIASSLHTKIHAWMDAFGFRLNASQVNAKRTIVTRHYFFKTFNFLESTSIKHPERVEFLCFDTYGESIKIKSLLDLQAAFFENISQLK
jgi:hypothetical protein